MQRTLQLGIQAWGTSRNPSQQHTIASHTQRLEFDLARPGTWSLPPGSNLIWCFPATPLSAVKAWADSQHCQTSRLVVLSSTSVYDQSDNFSEYPPPWIDESAPIDPTNLRVQGEEYLRTELGATILRVSGIYGPGRNPLDWIRQGRVGPSRKYLNLIHVEDLAAISLLALQKGKLGEVYNVSNGHPHTWQEICITAEQRWSVTNTPAKDILSTGKRISNAKLCSDLGYRFQYANLYEALDISPALTNNNL